MYSVLSEITRLRGGQKPIIDYRNSNHYRIVSLEENGFRTAYCFGVPIYNRKTRKLAERRFHESNGIGKAYGSNAEITAEDSIVLKNGDGVCYSIAFEFHNPDIAVLDCAEKLVIFRRNMIAGA